MTVPARRMRGKTWGSVNRPIRSGPWDMLVNGPPDGWVTERDPIQFQWVGTAPEPLGPGGPSGWASYPAAVERAKGLIVGPLANSLPWRVYRGNWRDDPEATEYEAPLWIVDPMLVGKRPGPGGSVFPVWKRKTRGAFWGEFITHALLFGKGWLAFAEDGQGYPTAGTLQIMNPASISDDDDGWAIGDDDEMVRTDPDGRFRLGDTTWRLVQLHEPLGEGNGVIGRHAASLRLAVNVRNYASSTFRSGVPNGYLKVNGAGPMTKDQADKLKASWLEAHGGDRRSIAVLSSTVDFTPISVKPIDAQLVDVDHMVLRTVAHAFNLSARALDSGASSSNSYANIQDERQDRLDDSVNPWRLAIQDCLTALLPYGTWLGLDTRGYLSSNASDRVAYYSAMQAMGAITVNEIRRLEKMPTLAEPDTTPPADVPALGGSDANAQ